MTETPRRSRHCVSSLEKLPVGFSERLHARIDLELQGTGGG
jgi:hypothetical protein